MQVCIDLGFRGVMLALRARNQVPIHHGTGGGWLSKI
jgi:hypothetical protein